MSRDSSESLPAWKRASDLIGGICALVVAAIPMSLISIGILLESGRPIMIKQRRIGLHGDEFAMWKFRTLPANTPQMAKSELLRAGLRSSRFARFLRRYSLDELPQLVNVVSGDMSLVGPRPALYTQADLIALRGPAGVFRVRPGLTGLAQVVGREDLTLEDKVALDAEYVRRLNPLGDLKIVMRTAGAVLRARGSY